VAELYIGNFLLLQRAKKMGHEQPSTENVMSQALLQPGLAETGEKQWVTSMCIYCFEEIALPLHAENWPGAVHFCEQKALAMQPAAPPPFN
jgi:hypothetical protein